MKREKYEDALDELQTELVDLARWLKETGRRIIVIFEGRDTAGKGGAINAIAEKMNPRQVHVAGLAKPSERERTQWYFQRYVPYLPAAGEMVLFDRSWYNRAGVEKVMGFCTRAEYRRFLEQAPVFERMLVDDGILIYKYWLAVDQRIQEERFRERAADPLKRWKLSPIDIDARRFYVEYGRMRDRMFKVTHTKHAPWFVVDFNDQRTGRLNLIRHLLDQVPDLKLPDVMVRLPRLKEKPAREKFKGKVKPIKNRY